MNEENKKKHYLIYQTTNLVNNKIYIGKHITENIEDQYFGSGKYLKRAIEKYGLENFEFKILFELQNKEEMNLLEKCVVTQEFCDREDTYNINIGGDGGWSTVNKNPTNTGSNHFFKNKSKEEISEIGRLGGKATAQKIHNMIPTEREKYRKLRSAIAKMGFSKQFLGKHHTTETKRKISETKKSNRSGIAEKNSQYGTMWICNYLTKENRKIKKTDPIPEGWRKGRICKKNKYSL